MAQRTLVRAERGAGGLRLLRELRGEGGGVEGVRVVFLVPGGGGGVKIAVVVVLVVRLGSDEVELIEVFVFVLVIIEGIGIAVFDGF